MPCGVPFWYGKRIFGMLTRDCGVRKLTANTLHRVGFSHVNRDTPISLWDATAQEREHSAPLDCDHPVDVAVVGGGFTGLSTALPMRKAAPSMAGGVMSNVATNSRRS